ncbi:MAG TPA: ATP-binding protein, partial [Candidatus Saccharimonadales bacterium]|nr:ATP-binding protein [Candidatus Saccharimonadales bacterium]
WLAGRGALTLAREFAMGFDQTRKALAFLFRRQVERAAERKGYADRELEDLPAPLREAFATDGAGGSVPVHDHFPGLDRLQEALAAWKERGGRGSFLLSGERGTGKSTWLARIDPGDLPCTRITLDKRTWLARDALRLHWEEIDPGAGAAPASVREATDRLLAGPKRIIVVDAGQNLFLASVGGFAAMETFASLVDGTCRQVYWVFSINAFTWAHVTAVRPDLKVFRDHQVLAAWNEEGIRGLIDARMKASGVEATYEDLAGEGLRGLHGRERDERLEQTRGAYVRLLWDYTDGNPRAAIYFWLESLVPEAAERVRVRAFRTPDPESLSAGGDPGLFVLGSIVLHENLSLAELARVTRFPEGVVRTHVDRFHDMGVLQVEDRRCRVTSRWHRAVVRRLRRSNLLPLVG